MKWIYKIFRSIIVLLIALLVVVPVGSYVALSLPPVQGKIRTVVQGELSALLDADVRIGSLSISPFNQITLKDVTIADSRGRQALRVRYLGLGIDLYELLVNRGIAVTYAELLGLDAGLYRETPDDGLNIQNIIDALSPKEKTAPGQKFDFKVNTIVIRDSQISYDVLSEGRAPAAVDPNHLKVESLRADIRLPRIKNDDFTVDLKRLAMKESSGFAVEDLHGLFHVSSEGLSVTGFGIELPNSSLAFSDIDVRYDGWEDLRLRLSSLPFEISTLEGSHLSLKDFAPFAEPLRDMDMRLDLEVSVSGCVDDLTVKRFQVSRADENLSVALQGRVKQVMDPEKTDVELTSLDLVCLGSDLGGTLSLLAPESERYRQDLSNLGRVLFHGELHGSAQKASFRGSLHSDNLGNIDLGAEYERPADKGSAVVSGSATLEEVSLGAILDNAAFGSLGADLTFEAAVSAGLRSGALEGVISRFDYKGYRYADVGVQLAFDGEEYSARIQADNPDFAASIDCKAVPGAEEPRAELHGRVDALRFDNINLWDKYPGYCLSASVDAELSGRTPDEAEGTLEISDVVFKNDNSEGVELEGVSLSVANSGSRKRLELQSDWVDASVGGKFSYKDLWPAIRKIMAGAVPALSYPGEETASQEGESTLNLEILVKGNEQIGGFLKLPVNFIHPVTVTGGLDLRGMNLYLTMDAPYLQQGDKLIEETALYLQADGNLGNCQLYLTTTYPTKNGPMALVVSCLGNDNRLDSNIDWQVERERTFKGTIDFSTRLDRDRLGNLVTEVDFNPGEMVFNDTVWTINPSKILYSKDNLTVTGFDVSCDNQYLRVDGRASRNPDDRLCLNLNNVSLGYVFETLGIDKVMLGGDATGDFYASALFSGNPDLSTTGLAVKNISFNKTVFGNATIKSNWDRDNKAVALDAEIVQADGNRSYIAGEIFPMKDSLDIRFDATRVDAGFLKHYMDAFSSDVGGYASGRARLWGNFKRIDLAGDIFAEDLRMKIDFTNTYYTATDSVHITPGHIDIDNITIRDDNGNTARLSGRLTHQYFKRPVYEFAVTDAENFLCYDMTSKLNPDWYGRIYGNGSTYVSGQPGVVNINVNMTTAPKSTFTYALTDLVTAGDYSFMTFRDKDEINGNNSADADDDLSLVKRLKERIANRGSQSKSEFNLNIQVEITPEAQINMVMDPVGGDRIRAYGEGNMQMTYNSANEDLKMYGTYTLERGNYNFTLQDIIIKDFDIRQGSSIAFLGDPYSAQLNIEAVYSLNANLSDLDESFLEDKELNRTNVPVHALLRAQGNMQQPDISFDLEFPTLTDDTYRKVKSIISTEDMMNRQIIYLLALNRFYTPDYMTTTKGNELFSVASSTISSQLSSILGQLSDNWSISPNLRSDRGDFSDVEVDVALSSSLLDNRLLFNGNFGYRDKSLNTNQFIGDFDIEYLLTRRGTWRLKAYNRYNDQNYYIKNATTTQGVGIVFKKDFDNPFSFFRKKTKKNKDVPVGDSAAAVDGATAAQTRDGSDWLNIAPVETGGN